MLEIYTVGYNLIANSFDYKESISNYCAFADRVTIAINDSDDGTFEAVSELKEIYNKLNVVQCSVPYNNSLFDGIIKDIALQNCVMDYVCGLDMDEKVVPEDRWKWDACTQYIDPLNSNYVAIALPSIDLCGSKNTCKLPIGSKQAYLTRRRGVHRGVVNYAMLEDGHINVDMSDSTEVIDHEGNLVPTIWHKYDLTLIRYRDIPYVLHDYAIDYDKRVKRNEFWAPHWSARAGKPVTNIILERKKLEEIPIVNHGLKLWDE